MTEKGVYVPPRKRFATRRWGGIALAVALAAGAGYAVGARIGGGEEASAPVSEATVGVVYEEPLPADIHIPSPHAVPALDPGEIVIKERRPPHDAVARPETAADALAPAIAAMSPLPAWRRYAVAAPRAGGRPRIAIVIDDLGIDRRRTARAIALPAPLTLAFLSYAGDLDVQTAAARGAGHELLVHVGMQPRNTTVDAGPRALLSGLDAAELGRRLDWHLGRFQGFVGLNNHMGSQFTADAGGMRVVLADVKRRGLLFLDSRTTPESTAVAIARRLGVPVASRNVFLDNVDDASAVADQLAETERIARTLGHAIAIGHPRDATLEALEAWLPEAARRGFVLSPISALVDPGRSAPVRAVQGQAAAAAGN